MASPLSDPLLGRTLKKSPKKEATLLLQPSIERALSKDLEELYAFELRCFDPGMAFHYRQFQELLRNPRADVWVMRHESHIIAQAIILRRKFRDGVHARIYSLTVDLAFRGKGLSRQLLLHVFSKLKTRKIRNIYLEVEEDAIIPIALYNSLGFKVHHRLVDYYEIGRHGLKMRKTLGL
ncbi:MAG: GNAT family N-acetyltransferase [Oligoflexus sp.]|nr:GNAT family N-acetyltransferase [Oligoflexus sp.]